MSESLTRWPIRKVRLSDAKPMPRNPRMIGDKALSGLEHCMERFGYVEPIVWNEKTGHIIGGHQRYKTLVGSGVQESMMVVVSLEPEEEKAANAVLNNPKIEGTWNDSALELLSRVEDASEELFKALNMDVLKNSLEMAPRASGESPPGVDVDGEYDTKCPCCRHEWNIESNDVSVETEA